MTTVQNEFLEGMINKNVEVSIFLKNGIKLLGKIKEHDESALIFTYGNTVQLIYKSAISTIVPNITQPNLESKQC